MIKNYIYFYDLSPDIMSTIFQVRQSTLQLRNFRNIKNLRKKKNSRTNKSGVDSIIYGAGQF